VATTQYVHKFIIRIPIAYHRSETNFRAFRDIPGATYPPDSGSGLPGVFWFPSSYDPVTITRSFSRTGHWDGLNRRNYQTILGSKVIKITFNGDQASGVQYVPSSATAVTASNVKTVKAKKEVILSAGSIHSPQILQSSGIGPKSVLKAANIPVKVELPGVGQNFQDHLFNPGHAFLCEFYSICHFPVAVKTYLIHCSRELHS
jgi:choline dehydrogenase